MKPEIDVKAAAQKAERRAQQKQYKALEHGYKAAFLKYRECSEQLTATEKNMETIVNSVQDTFTQAECGNSPIVQLLGKDFQKKLMRPN